MRKLLGYIPLDPGEDHVTISKETDVVKIEEQWFKLTEVWIPGVKNEKLYFSPKDDKDEFCKNCGRIESRHSPITKICPI